MFGQTFEAHDLVIVGILIVLEGVLSIDNALVLGLLAKRLPKEQQPKALTYGLVGAFVFRIISIALATYLLRWWVVKLLGGGYLVYIAVKHLFFDRDYGDPHAEQITIGPDGHPVLVEAATGKELPKAEEAEELARRSPVATTDSARPRRGYAKFWPTVFVIEMTDIAFAIDSILAAIAMVSGVPHPPGQRFHPKLWVIITGGFLGVILMRFAAVIFIKLLERFPRFETAAYLLVALIGAKLLADFYFNKPPDNHPQGQYFHAPLDFHSPSNPAFWVFWGLMIACFCIGFLPDKNKAKSPGVTPVV